MRNCPKFDRRETAQKNDRGSANGCNFCLRYFLPTQTGPFRRGGALRNASRAPILRFEETRRLSNQSNPSQIPSQTPGRENAAQTRWPLTCRAMTEMLALCATIRPPGEGGRRAPLVRHEEPPAELAGARNRDAERPVASPPSSTLISPLQLASRAPLEHASAMAAM